MSLIFETVKLSSIAKIYSGNSINETVKKDKFTDIEDGVVYISTKDVGFNSVINYENGVKIPRDELSNFKIAPAQTVFICAEGGSAGRKIAISDRELCFVNKLYAVVANDKTLPKFIFYSLKTNEFINQFKSFMTGIIGGVSLNKFKELEIQLPPLPIQHKIVLKLDSIFAEIDKAIRAAESNVNNSEALKHAYLDYIFNTNFYQGKKYTLGEVCKFHGGSQPAKSFFEYQENENNIRFIQIRDYKSDKNLVYIPKSLAKRFCNIDDVMIGRYGPPVFQILRGIQGSYNVALMKAIPNEQILTKDFLYFFLQNPAIQNYIISLSNRAAGQSGLNKETIEPYEINVPTLHEQNKSVINILNCFQNADKLKQSSINKIDELKRLKQSILHTAFNGELVKE